MKYILMLILLLLAALNGNTQEGKKNYEDAFKLIEVWLDAQKDFENIPSITAIVIEDQKILWSKAFGTSNLEKQSKADIAMICSICSITKSFTAVAIMKLIDEGKFNLDDKVKDILPFFKVKQKFPGRGAITVRSLLSHSSGLPGNTGHSYFSGPDFTFPSQAEFRSIFKEMEIENEVGIDINYSNVGYALLGEIIEKISGIPYETYLMNEVIIPLKMSNTYVKMETITDSNNQAVGYTAINRDGMRKRVNAFKTRSMQPAMGLWTTIHDLAKYASWQFRLRDAHKTEILEPSTLKNMHSVQSISKDGKTTWGFGFNVMKSPSGDNLVMHGGTCPGYVSLLQLNLTTKMGYAIMINANRSSTFKYINGIKQIMSKVKSIKEKSEQKINLEDYTGYYNMNPWNSITYISTWEEGLVALQLPENTPKYGMTFYKHIKGNTFRRIKENDELGEEFVFERDKKGFVYRYIEGGNYKNKMNY